MIKYSLGRLKEILSIETTFTEVCVCELAWHVKESIIRINVKAGGKCWK